MIYKRNKFLAIGMCIIALALTIYSSLAASLLNQTYMPSIYNQPTLTPTPQPLVLFPNGDFELGPVIWTQYSSNGWDLIYQQQELPQGVFPYDGVWVAWLGGDYSETSYVEQQVFVSYDLPYMSHWYWIIPSVGCVAGLGLVLVDGGVVAMYDLCSATGGWVQKVIDLRAYAGQSVLIQIRGECDASTNSDLFVDSVGFQSSLQSANSPAEDMIDIDISTLKQDLLLK